MVFDGQKNYQVRPRGILRKNSFSPLPGDLVEFEIHDGEGTIDKIYERKNDLIRPSIANVTQAILVFALKNPDINFELLNIFLAILEQKSIKPIIIFNKNDIADDEIRQKIKEIYNLTPYEFHFVSMKQDDIKSKILEKLKDNITVLMGPSGAGKSTLLNSILGEERMGTGSVSEKIGRGKHTTRHTELVEINSGLIADTPGFSSMDLIGITKDELKYLMPEFDEFNDTCRFTDCSHLKEPGCNVKENIDKKISRERYDFYYKSMEKLIEGEKRKWQ